MRGSVFALIGALALTLVAGCSDDASPATTTLTVPPVASLDPAELVPPRVDLIGEAVDALEAELGGPQQYFEINATPNLVNLFVALNDGAIAQPWVYVDGELSSQPGEGANGNTFAATALDFDPLVVLKPTQEQLDDPNIDVFEIIADAQGVAHYTLVVDSPAGGQLLVTVDKNGAVQAVDPN